MSIKRVTKTLASSLCLVALSLFVGLPAQAGMVNTLQIDRSLSGITLDQSAIDQSRVWIAQQLQLEGVAADAAQLRVASLSDAQVTRVQESFAELPAGASAGGVVLTIFLVFVITDVIGATDIFPFIRPVSK